jgi:hypothetical protein
VTSWFRHLLSNPCNLYGRYDAARTWGFSLGKGKTKELRAMRLHLGPGMYDESVFEGMDYALAGAAARGMRLIVSLEDYWLSIDRYIEWSPTAGTRTDFYTDWFCRNTYRDHIRVFLNRRNTITGVLYKVGRGLHELDSDLDPQLERHLASTLVGPEM